ncbi:hypothetical protein, partial [Collimonas sp.]|uniref:hypothetical protein n=1 Tax=Collimonas sp. TaxID=1963772 RepID=UPI0037C1AC42
TASSLNSAVYICFGIFFIAGLSKGSLILRYLWKTKFRGKLSWCAAFAQHIALSPLMNLKQVN